MLYASKQFTNGRLGDVSEKKGEPDFTSGSEQMKVENDLKWSLRKQLQIEQQNRTLMLPQQKPTGFFLICALKFLFSSELMRKFIGKLLHTNFAEKKAVKNKPKKPLHSGTKLCLHVLNFSFILGRSFNTGYSH